MKPAAFLDGHLLIAMPGIGDPRFERSVIFMCAHSEKGAMGIIVNKPAPMMSFESLIDRLDIMPEEERIHLPDGVRHMPVQFGGPVEPGRGFVLHTSDYFSNDTTLPIDERTGLTATLDILKAIAKGTGPRRALLALGYAGWGPGQLEGEMQRHGWYAAKGSTGILFDTGVEARWMATWRAEGIDPAQLSPETGRA